MPLMMWELRGAPALDWNDELLFVRTAGAAVVVGSCRRASLFALLAGGFDGAAPVPAA
jgi:hypothetical protein